MNGREYYEGMIALTDAMLFAFSQDDLADILQKYTETQSLLNRETFREEQRKKLAWLNQAAIQK